MQHEWHSLSIRHPLLSEVREPNVASTSTYPVRAVQEGEMMNQPLQGRLEMNKPLNRNLGGQNQNMGSQQRETRWLTPKPIVEALGVFDLDPCGAPGHSLATETFQIDDGQDGLELPWHGRVWLNPPYGKLTAPFLGKLAEHGQGTALVFARTETKMFFDHVWPNASAILFMKGRVSFLDADGVQAKANSGAPSVLVSYGESDAESLRVSGLGRFVRLSHE